MIRIRLGAEDLMRIRVAPTLGPFAETMSAAEQIRRRSASPFFSPWRRSLQGRLGPQVHPLAAIHPRDRPGLDLTTLVGRVDTIGEGIDALLSVHRQHFRAEIEWLSARHSDSEWPWRRLDSELRLRRELGEAITSFHAAAILPYWPQMRAFLQAERARQAHCMATAGIDRFLASLCPPLIQWHPPFLHVQSAGRTMYEDDLAGAGLIIVPSVFRSQFPGLTFDLAVPGAPRRLVYPAVRDLGTARQLWTEPRDGRALAALLGRTRSGALEAVADGCGTGELALRVGISPAAASQHAAVLRRAGLITTQRDGGSVMHALTSLGSALLNGERLAGREPPP